MSSQFDRALLLFQQSRFDLAEQELRAVLATDPHDAFTHSLLGLCLAHREQFKEATDEAAQAIHLAPDFPFAHYALASIYHDRDRNDEALAAITEALRLDASDADYFALLSQIHVDERHWNEALTAAEQGLALDSEHISCTNLRAIALVKLGRRSEAGATIQTALARNPENSTTHANQGWTLLESGDAKKALEHFREALRLDPENEWARRGIVEALKARNIVYAIVLRYFLWMGRFSSRAQWGIILGGYFGYRILASVSANNPKLAPWILPLQILYVLFVLLTWTASPLFNLLLRLNRFGRLALSREQTVASNWIGTTLLLALLALGVCLISGFNGPFLIAAMVFGFLVLPLAGTFRCPQGWPRGTMAAYTGVLACVGIGVVLAAFLQRAHTDEEAQVFRSAGGTLMGLFVIGIIGSSWIANILITQRRRR